MNKFNGYIALFVVFFVVFLGMRNPWLDNNHGPKRKGRAVISFNTFSKNLSAPFEKPCNDHNSTTLSATLLPTMIERSELFTATILAPVDQTTTSQLYLPICPSRAPPSPIS